MQATSCAHELLTAWAFAFWQVQLVMQFCDMGTLDAAIKGGVFKDADTELPHTVRRGAQQPRGGVHLLPAQGSAA